MSQPFRPDDLEPNIQFKWVPDYIGLYAATDDGRIFSFHSGDPKQLSPGMRTGYQFVILNCNGKKSFKTIHRLVYETFKDLDEELHVHHRNGNRLDNRLDNLDVMSASEHCSMHNNERGRAMVEMLCPCGETFIRGKNKTHLTSSRNQDSTYCSRACSGSHSGSRYSDVLREFRHTDG